VKYERDFNLQVDVALLDRVHELEAAAAQQTRDAETRSNEAHERLHAATEQLRELNQRLREDNQRLRLDLGNLADRTSALDVLVADLQARIEDVDARAAVANALASGAVEHARSAYDQLTARRDLADDRLRYADAQGRVQLGYQGGADAAPVYAGLDDVFRGSEAMSRERLRTYVALLQGRGPVVDLGSGRGEMLQLLAEVGVEACGVDLDDVLDFLIKQDDGSLGAIFSSQLIEQLPPTLLPELFDVARAKLRPGGVLIAETINAQSPRALKAFWMDPTHRHPLSPETMLALCKLTGFAAARIMFPFGTGDLATDLRSCAEYAVVAGDRVD
jgi:SAM-dependent methyltransferase